MNLYVDDGDGVFEEVLDDYTANPDKQDHWDSVMDEYSTLSSLSIPLFLSSSYFALVFFGISIIPLTNSGIFSPGLMSCQGCFISDNVGFNSAQT